MDVTSNQGLLDFSQQVLRGIVAIEPLRSEEKDLCLELGLSLWMRRSGTSIEEARRAMWGLRGALIEASGIDGSTEPIPLHGVDPRLDVVNLGAYLRRLIGRATARAQCDPGLLVERALGILRSRRMSTRAGSVVAFR